MLAPSQPEGVLPASVQRSMASLGKGGSLAPALQEGER